MPYIQYLASGSVAVSAALAATFEALYSAYSRMAVQKTWDSILNAPIALDDIVFAEMLWAAMKALFSCAAILVVIFLLGISRAPTMLLALPVLGLAGITFASLALVFNALAKGYDFFTYYFTLVITPMTFLSGVYFPIAQMPPWLQGVAQVLPLKAAVDLVRPLVLGNIPADPLGPLLILTGYACLRLLFGAGAHPAPVLRLDGVAVSRLAAGTDPRSCKLDRIVRSIPAARSSPAREPSRAAARRCRRWSRGAALHAGARRRRFPRAREGVPVLGPRRSTPKSVEVTFAIAPGYYLYREQFKFAAAGATLGAPVIPPGKVKFDETFQKNVETYRNARQDRRAGREARRRIPPRSPPARAAPTPACAIRRCRARRAVSLAGFGGDGHGAMPVAAGEPARRRPPRPAAARRHRRATHGGRASRRTRPAGESGAIEAVLRGGASGRSSAPSSSPACCCR